MTRRLLRYSFNLLTALSLLLCAAVCVLWVRSIGHVGEIHLVRPPYTIAASGIDGVCGILLTRDSGLNSPTGEDRLYGWFSWRGSLRPGWDRTDLLSPGFNRWGFGFHAVETIGRPPGGVLAAGGSGSFTCRSGCRRPCCCSRR